MDWIACAAFWLYVFFLYFEACDQPPPPAPVTERRMATAFG